MPMQIWLLFIIGALVMSSAPLLILVGGIVGHQLSPSESLKTLPIACFVIGVACATYPSVRAMGYWGRKKVFMVAAVVFTFAAMIVAWSLQKAQFYFFCSGSAILGVGYACFQQLRFAALELVPEAFMGKAASRIMLSGLLAALLGPQLSQWGPYINDQEFIGGFWLLAGFGVLVLVLLCFYREPERPAATAMSAGRPLRVIAQNPNFVLALCSAAVAFAVMSLVMTATPLTMHVHNHFDLVRTKEVIQAHIFAMFFPAFFTGALIQRWGATYVIVLGIICFAIAIGVAFWGVALTNFWVALLLLGVGWNFMFIGATALLPKAYRPEEQFRVQSLNDAVVFSCQALASLSAGWLLNLWGWQMLLCSCIPLLMLCLFAAISVKLPPMQSAADSKC